MFLTRKYYGSVHNQAKIGTTVLTVYASDADAGTNQNVAYSLVGPNDKFIVEEKSGNIVTKKVLTNLQQIVQLKVKATNTEPINSDAPQRSDTTIEINIVDRSPPIFKPSNVYSAKIPENVKPGTRVVNIKAESQIKSTNEIGYSLVKSNADAEQKFQVDTTTGEIKTASTLNFEQQKSFKLQIRAREIDLYATCSVHIELIDVNDDTPTFKLETYPAKVPENTPAEFNVITVKADDRDTASNFGVVTYSLSTITGTPSNDFKIISSNGTIFTKTSFNREVKALYRPQVTAADQGSPPLKAKVLVYVTIVDQNDQPPRFAERKYQATIQEDATIGTSIRDLSATDGDIGENARLDYFISSGDQSHFKMETVYGAKNYGVLILDGKLDFEHKKTYSIRVTATDRKDSDTVIVDIKVGKSRGFFYFFIFYFFRVYTRQPSKHFLQCIRNRCEK